PAPSLSICASNWYAEPRGSRSESTFETVPGSTQPDFHFRPTDAPFLCTCAEPLTDVVARVASTRSLTFHGPLAVVEVLQAWILPRLTLAMVDQWLSRASAAPADCPPSRARSRATAAAAAARRVIVTARP